MKLIKHLLPIIALVLLSYLAIKPFFLSGFFPMHDDTQVARVFEMNKSLSDGAFPVRWVSDLGYHYGYPIFNFYAPLAYYVGSFFMLLGFDALVATKIMMALGIILAGVFMYLLAKEFWGRGGGLVSAVLYVYAPYHAVDVYVRGDVAEFWAYAFIPLAFFGLWKAYADRKWIYVVIGAIGYAGIIISHNLTAMMITPFFLLFSFFLYLSARQEQTMHKTYFPLAIFLIGIILTAFYWLPVFSEMKYTNVLSQIGGGADYKDHFVCPVQLWDSPWGYGGSTPSCIDGLSFKIGKLHVLFFLASVISIFFLRKQIKTRFWFAVIASVSVLFSVFLMLSGSKFLWDTFQSMAFFQYPWRFLLTTTFFIAFLGGAVVTFGRKFIPNKQIFYVLIACLSLAVIFINFDAFVPQKQLHKTAADYTNNYALTWTASKISDEYMPKNFFKPRTSDGVPAQRLVSPKSMKILSLSEKTNNIHAQVISEEKTDMFVNLAYFPAWHVFIDGKQSWFHYFNKGMIITVPAGNHTIDVTFIQTGAEKLANVMTLTGVLILILGIIMQRKDTYHGKKST